MEGHLSENVWAAQIGIGGKTHTYIHTHSHTIGWKWKGPPKKRLGKEGGYYQNMCKILEELIKY